MNTSARSFLLACFSLVIVASVQASPAETNSTRLRACVQSALSGQNSSSRIVGPWDDYYTDARLGPIERDQFPSLIAYATSEAEVASLVRCGRSTGVQVVPRSGGHSFEAWSALNNSLVIDLAHIDYVNVASDLSTATVGGGLRLGALYTALDAYNRTFPGGICPGVGMGGYLGVGGYSMNMRKMGMAVESVTAAKLVMADGTVVTASATSNTDLFWGIRGGGQFGIVTEITVKILQLPRSAMVTISFPNKTTRYDVARKYLDWGPKTVPEFGSQINIYSNRTYLVGWLLGGSTQQLQAMVNSSGLADIPGAVVKVSGDCSTDNSRYFWIYTIDSCMPDDQAEPLFASWYNVVPEAFSDPKSISPVFQFNEVPKSNKYPRAQPWPRNNIINKTYFISKAKPVSDETLQGLIEQSGALPDEAGFWAELTSFNITSPNPTNSSAFAWEQDAYALFRAEVGADVAGSTQNQAFMNTYDNFLLPRLGSASYAGYVDASLASNPYSAYYGSNVCNLVNLKKQWDPDNLFTNPQQIPPYVPEGIQC